MICKIQYPLVTSESAPKVLIYNERKTIFFQTELSKQDLDALFLPDRSRPRVYAECKFKHGKLTIDADTASEKGHTW